MRFRELLRLALGGLRRTPLRMTLTVLGVAIATALLVSLVGFCLGVQRRVEEPFLRLDLFSRLNVAPKRDVKESIEMEHDPEHQGPPPPPPILDDEAVARMLKLPGVAVAYPEFRLNKIEVQGAPKKERTLAIGLPRASGRLAYVKDAVGHGRFFAPSRGPDEVVLGRDLAKKLGYEPPAAAVGQKLTLKVSGLLPVGEHTFKFSQREVAAEVVGVWDPLRGGQFLSTDLLFLPLDLARELPGAMSNENLDLKDEDDPGRPPGYRRVVVRVERPGDLFEVEEAIKGMGYQTDNWVSKMKELRELFILMDLVWGAVGAVALLVAGLGIINTMLMAVMERYREIGTYKALGASDGDVRLMFLAEAGLVGLLGGVLGLGLGRLVSWLCELAFNALARSKGIEEPMASSFPPSLLLCALGFAIVVSLISGVYPASRAARVDPIRALRSE